MEEEIILDIISCCVDIQTLANDQINDDGGGRGRQRLESRMGMIIEKADALMAMVSEAQPALTEK